MTHPTSLDLEAFACGDDVDAVEEHLAGCDACRAYVERVRGLTAPSASEAREIVARAARASRRPNVVLAAATTAVPLLLAAAIFMLLSRPEPAPTSAPPPATVALNDPEPETAFKGSPQIAVIRERGGEQKRFTSTVTVRPGDRLRIEVALDRSETILGAVLGDDGSYLEIMPTETRARGMHLSERSARVDTDETRGTIVVGSPEAVARARNTRVMKDVAVIRVEWEGP